MFGIRRDNVIMDDIRKLIQADSSPCISYIIITRCDKQENGFDNCDCDLGEAGKRALIAPYKCSYWIIGGN